MKIARFFAYVFACIGILLLIGSMGFFLLNRNADVRILELPREAVSCSEDFARALNDGDLEAAAQYVYGQPDLGVDTVPENPESALLWEAFVNSISFEFPGNCYMEQNTLIRRGSITTLDISSVIGKLRESVQYLLDQRIASAQSLEEIYDAQNQFREDLVTQILDQALQQALAQDGQTVTREVTLKLVNRDDRWWVVPDQNLLQILTGLA